MAQIVSGASSDILTIDPTSKAARITWYGTDGTPSTNIGKQTFMAATAAFTPPATPTDIWSITGSATKTVRLLRLGWSNTQTTAGVNTWFVIKRSSVNTGGSPTTLTLVPNDSNNAAATATVVNYTANPSPLGSSSGPVWTGKINSPAPATAGIGGLCGIELDFVDMFGQPLCLRGTTQQLALNFNGAALPAGLSMLIWCQWTEE